MLLWASTVFVLAACHGDNNLARDSSAADSSQADARTDDTAVFGDSAVDAVVPSDGGKPLLGFLVREPKQQQVKCVDPMTQGEKPFTFGQTDFICTFVHQAISGHVYFRSDVAGCDSSGIAPVPKFSSGGAWLAFNGVVQPITGGRYSYGGAHNNDAFEFDYNGRRYRYDHSSFGVGYRKCQPMDCLKVYTGTALSEDGCTPERKLPIVCRQVKADASIDPLTDTFQKCPGDPN